MLSATVKRSLSYNHYTLVTIDWNTIEDTWFSAATDAIVVTVASHPNDRLYAGAFWLLYGDYSSILAPAFGLNAEDSDPSVKWHPPDWKWSLIDQVHEQVESLYQPLLELNADESTYEGLWERHIDVLAAVSKRLTAFVAEGQIAAPSSAFAPNFFVGIIDFGQGDRGAEYLRRSVDEHRLIASGILDEE